MRVTWILIADGAKARLLGQDPDSRHFKPSFEQEFFGSSAESREIASDRPGRSFDSAARGQPGDVGTGAHRHAMEPSTDPKRHAKLEFARELAERLEKAANTHEFDRLVLVAAAKTLGDLRELMPDTVRDKIIAELDKDLTNVPTADLGRHLDPHLPR